MWTKRAIERIVTDFIDKRIGLLKTGSSDFSTQQEKIFEKNF